MIEDRFQDIFVKDMIIANNKVELANFGMPAAADNDLIVTSVNLTNTSFTIAAQPDVPRNVTFTITDTTPSITSGTITVTGLDPLGNTITEVFAVTAGAGLAKVGSKLFAKINSVVASSFTVLGGSGDETIIVGTGTKIGLPTMISSTSAVKHVYFNGARVASPTVNAGLNNSSVDVTAVDGTKSLLVFYKPFE